jgi:rfaE bifunctional protein kinase chain/domain
MNAKRFEAITQRYSQLRVALIGDFCLDRYLEIDLARNETSIETSLEVYNVVRVRSQPGAAGTILNNLVALGAVTIYPIGFCGVDGEGFELRRALAAKGGVNLDYFVETDERRTFTYCKPLIVEPGKTPRELNRLDSKNWSPTPASVQSHLVAGLDAVAAEVDAIIVMDQVDVAETGVVSNNILKALRRILDQQPDLLIIADSRRSLGNYPPAVAFKMNQSELRALTGSRGDMKIADVQAAAAKFAQANGRPVFVTLSEQGIVGADGKGNTEHLPVLPVRGEIDIVGAGDAVTANLTAALAGGSSIREAIELANAAASVVIHQLGTTGTASVAQLREIVCDL